MAHERRHGNGGSYDKVLGLLMKRWQRILLLGVSVAVVVVVSVSLHSARARQAAKAREVYYEFVLFTYSQDFKLGMSRANVEHVLQARKTAFTELCCIDATTYTDLVKIGDEAVPWYCSENTVYVSFQFTAVEPQPASVPYASHPSDVLKGLTIFRHLTGCL
jgi:hypothetical protein